MPFVVREGDSTSSGGFVLTASGNETIDLFRIARMGDLVWCPACKQVGYIAQGNPTWVDDQVAVATDGQLVTCGCKSGTNHLKASQNSFQADMEATIDIPDDLLEAARKNARQMTRSIKDGTFNLRVFRPVEV